MRLLSYIAGVVLGMCIMGAIVNGSGIWAGVGLFGAVIWAINNAQSD